MNTQQLTTLQENLKKLVEDYKLFNKEYVKYEQRVNKYEMEGNIKRDFEEHMQKLKAEMNKDDYSAKLTTLQEKLYKTCKYFADSRLDRVSTPKEINKEFIKSIGLDFSITPHKGPDGNYYTFYIDNKMMFSRFDLYQSYAYAV